jgi:hypothetical protein
MPLSAWLSENVKPGGGLTGSAWSSFLSYNSAGVCLGQPAGNKATVCRLISTVVTIIREVDCFRYYKLGKLLRPPTFTTLLGTLSSLSHDEMIFGVYVDLYRVPLGFGLSILQPRTFGWAGRLRIISSRYRINGMPSGFKTAVKHWLSTVDIWLALSPLPVVASFVATKMGQASAVR